MPERSTSPYEKKTGSTGGGERSTDPIEDVLNRLGEILRGASQPQPGGSPQPKPAGPVTVPPLPPQLDLDPTRLNQLREWLATEVMYLQLIPPVTPNTLLSLDRLCQEFPDLLKSIKSSPYLGTQIGKVVAEAKSKAATDGGRSTSDSELQMLVDRMARDISGSAGGERIVPIILAFCGAIALGRAIYDVTH